MSRSTTRPDGLRLDTAPQAPERASMSPSFSLLSIPLVSPEPAYIAAAAASNVVTGEVFQEYHVELDGASVAAGSLNLINNFLDRLLFNFLSRAHSTSLASLRPAVTEVLRPRLAKEAIAGADEELQEYLGGDVDELNAFHGGEEPSSDWDLELVWKRTRLRCMLYTRLGDMEEEDEEFHLEQENLNDGDRSISRDGGMVSPAVAIFLTSVLEFVGEHALMIAAQASYKRHETRARIENSELHRINVEEADMEKVALNYTLGRLWRSWRASLRSPRGSVTRIPGIGPRGLRGFSIGSRSSMGTTESHQLDDPDRVPSVAEVLDGPDPSNIPLPSTEHDIDEIEVPGYSAKIAEKQRKVDNHNRPVSMFVRTDIANKEDSESEEETEEEFESQGSTPRQLEIRRRPRARSLPPPETPFFVPREYPESEGIETESEETLDNADLKEQGRPIIDMAGNSVAEIKDYAIPKSSSAPTSPYHGSVLNAIAAQAAQGFGSHPRTSYVDDQSELDPADGALQFDRADYKIDDIERANFKNRVSVHEAARNLKAPVESPTHAAPVSPLIEQIPGSPGSGRVSPVGHASIRSGEVSPIEPSDDEEELYIEPVEPLAPIPNPVEAYRSPPKTPVEVPKSVPVPQPVETFHAEPQRSQGSPRSQVESLRNQVEDIPEIAGSRSMQGRQRTREGPTEHDYTKEENREAYVIPQDFNIAQPPEELPNRALPNEADLARKYRPQAAEKASTTLLPVKERDQPPEIPDKGPVYSANQGLSRKAVPSTAPTRVVPPAKSVERRQVPVIATDGIAEPQPKAGRSPVTGKDPIPSQVRISESSSRDSKTVKSQQLKGKTRAGSLVGEQYRDSVPSRSSSDGNKSFRDDKFSRSSTSTDAQRDFDNLISSGETLQYTLTPQNMRDIETRGSPVQQQKPTTPVQLRSRTSTDRSSPKQTPRSVPQPSGPSPAAMNGLNSHPTPKPEEAPSTFVIHSGPTVKRGPQFVAKDARMESTNTSDLKDFLRSTGPDLVNPRLRMQEPPRPVAKPKKSPQMAPPVLSPASSTSSNRPKPRFEPREPTRGNNDTSMLAEFLREGPPGAHRVPGRTDSDDFQGRARDSHSVASTQDSFVARSVQSSANSRTGLLDSSRNNGGKMSTWEKRSMGTMDEPPAPVRKQRRVRDPYAIDLDSDEEEEAAHTPRASRKEDQEESLLDFLRSAPPPGANVSPPPIEVASKPLQRRPSGSMRARFALPTSKMNKRTVTSPNQQQSRGVSSGVQSAYNRPSPSAGDPHLYARQQNTYGASQNSPRQPVNRSYGGNIPRMNGGGVRQARKLARDGREDTNSVRDLAEFLRNTGPPPPQPPLPPTPVKEEGGFTRMFSRRKKSATVS